MTPPSGIFFLLTPPGEGGIAVIGVEGDGARRALASALECPRLAGLRPGRLALGRLLERDGRVLDEVIVACLAPDGPRERFELNCHAGAAAASAALERLAEAGLRRAPPDAGRGALPPAERDFRSALAGLRTLRQLDALAAAHAALPDELCAMAGLLRAGRTGEFAERLGRLTAESARLQRLLAVHRLVLAGPVNAGKSTLFNCLAGAERSIVSPHPGTTRDCVEAGASLRGLAVDLVDTAGLGTPGGELEARAMDLARHGAHGAGLLLAVLDASAPTPPEVRAELEGLAAAAGGCVLVLAKADLPAAPGTADELRNLPEPLRVSARTGQGMDELLAAVERALLPAPPRGGAAAGPEALAVLAQAGTCAEGGFGDNPAGAAAEAARAVESLLEAGNPGLDTQTP